MKLITEESVLIRCIPEEGDRTLTVPEGVERIKDDALELCTEITAIILPKSLKSSHYSYFPDTMWDFLRRCPSLQEIQVNPDYPELLSADGLLYERDSGGLELLVCPPGRIGEVVLSPETVSIGNGAFRDCRGITGAALPEGLTGIGALAFADCTGLQTLRVPETVTYIGSYAFKGCTGLESITLPGGLEELAEGLFWKCGALRALSIPDNVWLIGRSALSGCESLQSVHIPKEIGLFGCLDPELGNIEENPFSCCPSLSEFLTDEDSPCCTEGGLLYFRHKDGSKSLVSCPGTAVGAITIPEGVTDILSRAFEGCAWVTSVSLPGTVKSIGSYAFRACPALREIRMEKENPAIFTEDGLLYTRNEERSEVWLEVCPGGKRGAVTIPEGVTSLYPYAFAGCAEITAVRFPETVWGIGWNAFENCTALREVTLTEGLKVIRQEAFAGCCSLSRVIFPESLLNLSSHAFTDCDAEVILSESMSVLGGSLPEGKEPNFGKYWYPKSLNRANSYVRIDSSDEEIIVPEGVKTILSGAFDVDGRPAYVRLRLPRSVTSIEEGAFEDIPTLREVIVDIHNPVFFSENGALYERTGNGAPLPIFLPPKE